jgi:hypothetical protein
MNIQHFAVRRRGFSAILTLTFLLALTDIPAFARPAPNAPVRISNQDVRLEGEQVLISYDLEGPEGGTYIVTIELRRESDPSFRAVPSAVIGDIGEVKTPGPHKLIRWQYLGDYPVGLRGDDYYFRIEVNRSGGFPWLWVGLGSAAVAGGLVAIVASKSSAGPSQAGLQELPLPPAR